MWVLGSQDEIPPLAATKRCGQNLINSCNSLRCDLGKNGINYKAPVFAFCGLYPVGTSWSARGAWRDRSERQTRATRSTRCTGTSWGAGAKGRTGTKRAIRSERTPRTTGKPPYLLAYKFHQTVVVVNIFEPSSRLTADHDIMADDCDPVTLLSNIWTSQGVK